MYNNNILNFLESTTILNACTKESVETYWMHHVYMICKHILLITSLNKPDFIFFFRVKWHQSFLHITNISISSFVIRLQTIKWFYICIINNTIKDQLFVYTVKSSKVSNSDTLI